MARPLTLRGWSTPLTMGDFVLMAGTGVLMFFGIDPGLTAVAHQWFSWLFLLGAGGHIAANIRPLGKHLRSPLGRASVAGFAIVLAASCHDCGLVTGPQLERPIEQALVDAPLSTLAGITRTAPDTLLGRLKAHGIAATGGQSIREIATRRAVDENRLLAIIFLPDR